MLPDCRFFENHAKRLDVGRHVRRIDVGKLADMVVITSGEGPRLGVQVGRAGALNRGWWHRKTLGNPRAAWPPVTRGKTIEAASDAEILKALAAGRAVRWRIF